MSNTLFLLGMVLVVCILIVIGYMKSRNKEDDNQDIYPHF